MVPFKIAKGSDIAKVTRDFFGKPTQETLMSGPDGQHHSTEIQWHFYDSNSEINLSMTHLVEGETLSINITRRELDIDNTMCGHYSPGNTTERLNKFFKVVSKPWDEWTEEEIMEHPSWITLYRENTGKYTEAMNSRMVMESYKDPNDKWVKRYFGINK